MDGLSARRVAERLLGLVEFVMPGEHEGWARAMKAEAAYVESDAATLRFAAGCLRAACLEWSRTEIRKSAAVFPAGAAVGTAFSAHAMISGSHAWPYIWPLLGGTCAVLLYARDGRLGILSGARLGLRTGAVAGLLFAIAGAIFISASADATLGSRLHVLAVGTLGGAALSAVGGGAAALLGRFRP